MKIVVAKFSGPVPEKGWAIINYTSPDGGRTNIGHQFVAGDTWESVSADLVNRMQTKPWPEFVRAKADDGNVRMSCPDELDPTVFFAEYNPSPTQGEPHQLNPDFVAFAEDKF